MRPTLHLVGATNQTVLEGGTAEHSDRPHRAQARECSESTGSHLNQGPSQTQGGPGATTGVTVETTGLCTGIQDYALTPTLVTEVASCDTGKESSLKTQRTSSSKNQTIPRCLLLIRPSCSTRVSHTRHGGVLRDTTRGKTSH